MEHRAQTVSRETSSKLGIFADILSRWSKTINLVGKGDLADLANRHVADALQLTPLMPAGIERALDMGSGGGFPGLVLAIATGVQFTLVESDARKCAFLREAVRATGAQAVVVNARIESVELRPFPLITARAVASLGLLLSYGRRLLAPGGVMLFPKGARVDREINDAEAAWTMKVERHISTTHRDGVILRISEVERA